MENLLIFPLNEIIKIDYTLHQQKIKHQLNSAREKQDDFLKSCVSAKKKIDNEKEVEKQMNFYISDMHLGHKKIIQMSKRPFENKEMAYNLYSICKQYKRKVHLLKPSTNSEISNKFLWQTQYNYDYINESIINYKEAIRKKEIVIIDMEVFKYKLDAIRATAMLLLQLRLDLQDTDITQRHSHFLYVDDAYYYMAFLDDLLKYGATYNLGTTLFLESRNQLLIENKDYRNVVEDHVRNIILLNKISMEDYHYYKELFNDKIFDNFFSREITTLVFQSVDMKGQTRTGIAKMKQVNTINLDEIVKKSKKIRATLLKEKRKNRENELRESQYSHEPTPIDDELLKAIADETEYVPEQKMEIKKMEEEIREKIVEEEKVAKRKLAENIFNDYNRHVEFCDDLFKFS